MSIYFNLNNYRMTPILKFLPDENQKQDEHGQKLAIVSSSPTVLFFHFYGIRQIIQGDE